MKRKTRIELVDELNKVSAERTRYIELNIERQNTIDNLNKQLAWHRQLNDKLVQVLHDGAKEANFPRRAIP